MNLHLPIAPAAIAPARKRFTWSDLVVMGEAGLFAETERVELIGGEVFVMPPEGNQHANAVHDMSRWLRRSMTGGFEVFQRAPVCLSDDTTVVPDISVFPEGTRAKEMRGDAAALIIEASFSTQRQDLADEAARYAAAGVREYWVADLARNTLWMRRDPGPDRWGYVRTFVAGERALPLCAAGEGWLVA